MARPYRLCLWRRHARSSAIRAQDNRRVGPSDPLQETQEFVSLPRLEIKDTDTHQVQVSERDWVLMWDHVACQFTSPPFWDPIGLECVALHKAVQELAEIPEFWSNWSWPPGQMIAICILQLDVWALFTDAMTIIPVSATFVVPQS